eukprot:TRINITY_DN7812_c0_g1_i1.p1 TRINITY_DN7812_c0_g1~~TRINITY_DN7812_c0_g1_i1.p1  ORF type:complete len:652 (+),score=140.25 TRINITY_DN7812_c0_g1_i1:78-2033(+)
MSDLSRWEPLHEEEEEKLTFKQKFPCWAPKKQKTKEMGLIQLYALLPKKYYSLLVVGGIAAIIYGGVLPSFSIVFGELLNTFLVDAGDEDKIKETALIMAMIFIGLGLVSLVTLYISIMCFSLCGEKITMIVRFKLFDALIHKNVSYYDATRTGEITSRLSSDIVLIQGGVSEKVAQVISYISQVVAGLIIAFIYSWKLTLVLLAMSPLLVVGGALEAAFLTRASKSGQKAYSFSLSIAEESFAAFRTVISFVLEDTLAETYVQTLLKPYKLGVKKAHMQGAGIGFAYFAIFAVYAMGFWYGGKLVADGDLDGGYFLTVFFAVVIGMMGVGQAGQLGPDLTKGKASATELFKIIRSENDLLPNEFDGVVNGNLKGSIEFRDVKFSYPQRKQVKVFNGLNFKVKPGQKVALVGTSGGGKSTTIALIERFYDAEEGEVLIDGEDIKNYNLYWLRNKIGLVSQEPILFSCSIGENIRFGNFDATEEDIKKAAKQANAHKFIKSLPDGYDTKVGEKGTQLSGGQKQRVAIARAILKDPKILLLDEATSALDTESEKLVQDALDVLMKGRTTVIIAHRLATVRQADKICVMSKGKIVEMGTHEKLMDAGGEYALLVSKQLSGPNQDSDSLSSSSSKKSGKKAVSKDKKKPKKKTGF